MRLRAVQGAAKHAILERVGGTTPRFYRQGASLQSRPTETTRVCPGGRGSRCRDGPSLPPHLSTEEHAQQGAAVTEGQPLSMLQTEGRRAGQQGLADHTGHAWGLSGDPHPCRTFLQGISPLGTCSLHQVRLWLYLPSSL